MKSVAGGIPTNFIHVWAGAKWCGFPGIFNGSNILSAEFYHDTLFVGGSFTTIDNDSIFYIAKYLGGDYVDTCSTPVGINPIQSSSFDFSLSPNPAENSISIYCEIPFQS